MKRVLSFILIVFLLLFFFCVPATAHSGRTDSSGGHYDRSTGEYHYHHGEPAHQHPNGICPYDVSGKVVGTILLIVIIAPTILFWGWVIRICTSKSSDNNKKENNESKSNYTPDPGTSIDCLFKTAPLVHSQSSLTKFKDFFDEHPEFSDRKIYDVRFIDGAWRNVFKDNVTDEMKTELKKILPKQLYDELNYQSKK